MQKIELLIERIKKSNLSKKDKELLLEKLENNNYNVFMIRTSNDVNISNKERATMATNAKCDIYVRIHADGSDNRSVNGISMQTSASKNPYVGAYFNKSDSLSKNNFLLSNSKHQWF